MLSTSSTLIFFYPILFLLLLTLFIFILRLLYTLIYLLRIISINSLAQFLTKKRDHKRKKSIPSRKQSTRSESEWSKKPQKIKCKKKSQSQKIFNAKLNMHFPCM